MKQELYYINNDKKDPHTWEQILYWCYTNIVGMKWDYDYNRKKYGYIPQYNSYDHQRINIFFSDFRNNPNDGDWSRGYWKDILIDQYEMVGPPEYYSFNGEYKPYGRQNIRVYKQEWIPPVFTPKKYQVTDSYGRIIPSGYIRECYLKYIPNEKDNNRKKYSYRWYRTGCGTGSRNGHWQRYRGNHGSTISEMRRFYADRIERKEVQKEYNVSFKIRGTRSPHYLDPWDWRDYRYNHQHGWKRSRNKKKQWM